MFRVLHFVRPFTKVAAVVGSSLSCTDIHRGHQTQCQTNHKDDAVLYKEILRRLVNEKPFTDSGNRLYYTYLLTLLSKEVVEDAALKFETVSSLMSGLNVKMRPQGKDFERVAQKIKSFETQGSYRGEFDPLRIFCDFIAFRIVVTNIDEMLPACNTVRRIVHANGGIILDNNTYGSAFDGNRPTSFCYSAFLYLPSVGHVVECQILHALADRIYTLDSLSRVNTSKPNFWDGGFYSALERCVVDGRCEQDLRKKLKELYAVPNKEDHDIDPELLRMVGELPIIDAAATIIFNEKREALILQRGGTAPWMPMKWALPGGGIDIGEIAEDAAIRESQEEANLTPEDVSHLCRMEYMKDHYVSFFVARRSSGIATLVPDPKLGFPEHCAFVWVSKEQLNSYEFVPTVKEALTMAFDKFAHCPT